MSRSEPELHVKLLKGKAQRYALYGVITAVAAVAVATALVSYYEAGTVTLAGMIDAQKSNSALWLLDVLPFFLAFWGKHVSSIMAYEASAMVINQTRKLRSHTTELEQQAMHELTHDHLTGLPNRVLLRDRLDQALHSAQHERTPLAILLMDLDRFKEVNATLGHYNGDRLLKEVGARLQGVVKEADTVGRLGGDEFAVLLTKIAGIKEAAQVAQNIGRALQGPFELEGLKLDVQGSIGIAVFPEHGPDADTLLQRADVAMYMAKQQRRAGYVVYDPKLDEHIPHKLILTGELRHAIETDELVLHYQPTVNLKTRQVTTAQALVRWQHPRYDLLSPDDFIPLAERWDLIKPLTLWVLSHALKQYGAWRKEGLDIGVAVNMSVHALSDVELPDLIAGFLTSHDVVPDRLILEITETSVIVDEERALQIVRRLTDMGVRLSVDNFGTGYSAFGYLSKLPVSEVKIDKSYVLDMAENPQHAKIVKATVGLARDFGLAVIAEGTANEQTFTELEKLGYDAVQGEYISQPLSAEDFSRWIQDSPWHARRSSAPS